MTEKIVIKEWICLCNIHKPQTLIFPNVFIDNFEADIIEITKSGYIHEYEIKLTKEDFRHDSLKGSNHKYEHVNKQDIIIGGKYVNTFSYVVPKNMILVTDIPEYAGLIYFEKYRDRISFNIIKNAKRLSKDKLGDKRKEKCLLSTYYRFHSYFKK